MLVAESTCESHNHAMKRLDLLFMHDLRPPTIKAKEKPKDSFVLRKQAGKGAAQSPPFIASTSLPGQRKRL